MTQHRENGKNVFFGLPDMFRFQILGQGNLFFHPAVQNHQYIKQEYNRYVAKIDLLFGAEFVLALFPSATFYPKHKVG